LFLQNSQPCIPPSSFHNKNTKSLVRLMDFATWSMHLPKQ